MFKVVIVDDEPLILQGLQSLISWEELGLEIIGRCSNATEALELLTHCSAHIRITDIKMHEMNGLELISACKARKLNMKYVVLSGYDDFEYVKKAIELGIENYLLKPVSVIELKSTMQTIAQKIESEIDKEIEFRQGQNILKDNILYRWVAGDIDKGEFIERAKLLHIFIGTSGYLTTIIKMVDHPDRKRGEKIPQQNLLRFAIQNICSEIIADQLHFQIFCSPEEDVVLVFSHDSDKNISYIKEILQQCVEIINKLLKVDVLVTIGSLESMFQNVQTSFNRAKRLQNYQLLRPSNSILIYEAVIEPANAITQMVDGTELQIAIVEQDRGRSIRFVEDIVSRINENNTYNSTQVQEVIIEILFHIKYALRKKLHDPETFALLLPKISINTFANYSISQSLDEIKSLIHYAIDLLERKPDDYSPIISKVKAYIERFYTENINLSTVSEKFNISPGYLGYIFKKQTGEQFTNYINLIRIQMAKKMLTETNMKIAEIAEQVGYLNTNYFFTTFKKLEQLSPAEFRRNLIQ